MAIVPVPGLYAADLSAAFKQVYKDELALTSEERTQLKDFNFYLVPGILSEAFLSKDERSRFNFSRLTGDYFSAQEDLLKQKYGFSSERLSSSSRSVEETRLNIRKALEASRLAKKKALFITHSLGGLALLQELVSNEPSQKSVAGIIFLQSPFQGTPIADIYTENKYNVDVWLKPILPFFNTSEETMFYLSTANRKRFMLENKEAIRKLVKGIPVVTVAGVANDHKSLFKPAIDIMMDGCIAGIFSKCLTATLFNGPYDQSDGMVPVESSKLEQADFVKLEGVDHGETVVDIPYETYKKGALTLTLLKLLLQQKKMGGVPSER